MTSSSQIKWHCPECQITMEDRRKYCDSCKSMVVWTCVSSGKSGLCSNYHQYLTRCDYCTPELEEERQKLKEEKQISKVQELQTLYDGGHTCNDCFYSFLYSRTTFMVRVES